MEITEVRIRLIDLPDDRLQAFCSITFDHSFVVRDLKIIDGPNGPFVAMPSRKIMGHCPRCRCKNPLRSNFCNQCGLALTKTSEFQAAESKGRLYADIAHPINAECREMIQRRIVEAFREELERARQPGYRSTYEDIDEVTLDTAVHESRATRETTPVRTDQGHGAQVSADALHHSQRAHLADNQVPSGTDDDSEIV